MKCSFCNHEFQEGEWRIERYKTAFCDNSCMMNYASKLEPKSFGSLLTRLIPRPEPPTVRIDRKEVMP